MGEGDKNASNNGHESVMSVKEAAGVHDAMSVERDMSADRDTSADKAMDAQLPSSMH